MPQHEPAPADELEARLAEIRTLIIKGLNQAQIVKYVETELKWPVVPRQIRNYYQTVMEQMRDEASHIDRAFYFTQTVARLNFLYSQSVKITDFKTALSCTVELAKLLRLSSPQAAFDWRVAAKEAGLPPSELLNRAVDMLEQMSQSGDGKESEAWMN